MNIAVFGNQKGGVGKSTLSVLYALWLSDVRGQAVCFIDLDAQGNASKSLRRFGVGAQAAQLFTPGDRHLQAAMPAAEGRMCLLAASRKLADIELLEPGIVIPAYKVAVRELALRFDAVVVDTPPALGLRLSAALIAATHVVCPIELEEYSIDGVTDMLKTVFGIRQRYNPELQLAGLVLNRFNGHSVRQKEAMKHLVESFGEFVVPARISNRSSIPEALAEGRAVWESGKSAARSASLEVRAAFEMLDRRMRPHQDDPSVRVAP